jgi:hypothetical protein
LVGRANAHEETGTVPSHGERLVAILAKPLHAATDPPNTGQIAAIRLYLLRRAFDKERVSVEINGESMKSAVRA